MIRQIWNRVLQPGEDMRYRLRGVWWGIKYVLVLWLIVGIFLLGVDMLTTPALRWSVEYWLDRL